MEKPLIDKVREALEAACQPDPTPDIRLETAPPDKVTGLVLSRTFAKQSPSRRQARIWKQLKAKLTSHEQARVLFIVADTPEEHAALQDERLAG
jgi:hypothetical protein